MSKNTGNCRSAIIDSTATGPRRRCSDGTEAMRAETGSQLIGREQPLLAIDELLSMARSGRGSGVALEGVAGVGKTALVGRAIRSAEAQGFDIRLATGVPVEADLPFSVLNSILAIERRDVERMQQFPALAASLGMQPATAPPSVLSVAAEALELLSVSGRSAPILIVLDDLQWADQSSIEVLAHVGRHCVADRVAVLLAHRPLIEQSPVLAEAGLTAGSDNASDTSRWALIQGVEHLYLETLTHVESVAALVQAGCPPARAERWAIHCGGLPLAIAEVGRKSATVDPDPSEIAQLLPDVYRQQVANLPLEVVGAALHAAICSNVNILRSVDPNLVEMLRDAESVGLATFVLSVQSQEWHVAFRHPLLRAAVLASATSSRERAVHRRVATACLAVGDEDRAAIHLASGADGADHVAADAIGLLGDRAFARGALVEAASAWVRSASLQSTVGSRSPLLTRAADAMFDHGDAAGAFRLLDDSIRSATTPHDDADARSLRSRISTWVTSPKDAVRGLVDVATAMRVVDPVRAARALASASTSGYLDGDLPAALERGREAEQLANDCGDLVSGASASAAIAWNSFMVGDWEDYERRMAPLEPFMRALLAERSWAGIHLAELFATTWVCAERWDEAEPLIRLLLHTTREMGARLTAASTSLLLASLCWRRGRWDEAYALSAPLLNDLSPPPLTAAWMQVLSAQLLATMGRADETRALLDLGLPVAATADVPLILAMGQASLGHLELSLGHDEIALAHLDRVAEITERMGFREPEYFPWHGDYLDALVRAGRHSEARDHLRILSKLGDDGDRRWVKGIVARTLAQLADGHDSANALYEDALSCFEGLGVPFEVARTLLMRGGGQDKADARRLFLRLGASIWAERASRRVHAGTTEAADSLSERANDPPRVLELLTPQERNVALAVVSGRTNREIAAELHLSVKTIDHYLQRAYRRIGVKNRTELAIAVAQALAAPRRP